MVKAKVACRIAFIFRMCWALSAMLKAVVFRHSVFRMGVLHVTV